MLSPASLVRMKNKGMRHSERLAPIAATLSALGALACCLPLGIAGAIGALGLSAVLASLRPWLIGAAVVLLGVGLYQLYRGQRSCHRQDRKSVVEGKSVDLGGRRGIKTKYRWA